MVQDRRSVLGAAGSIVLASVSSSLLAARAAKPPGPAALLLPRSGPHAALGRSMERAARLAQGADAAGLLVFDTATGPADAARQALRRGAAILLGPVFAGEVRPVVVAAGGRIPVVTFSNDAGLLESGAFLLGITAAQGVAAILRYARARGVRRVAMIAAAGGWGDQALAAARTAAAANALDLVALPAGTAPATIATLGGGAPDAVLAIADGGALATLGGTLRASGIQLLGAFQGFDATPSSLAALEGAWLSAPDPSPFADFARSFEAASGTAPGIIAALAYDAARIATMLRAQGPPDRSGLLAVPGFRGVCGDVRFRADGSALRDLAILTVQGGRLRVADHSGLA